MKKSIAYILRSIATFFNWAANKLDGGMIKKQDGGGGGWWGTAVGLL